MLDQNPAIPTDITKYFWGDNLSELSLEKHEDYISQTLLDRGDQSAIRWLFSNVDKESLKAKLPNLKLSPRSAHFWTIYLS